MPRAPIAAPSAETAVSQPAGAFTEAIPGSGANWTVIPGLGRTGEAITVLPTTARPTPSGDADRWPRVTYRVDLPSGGDWELQLELVPTHPIAGGFTPDPR